MARVLVTPHVLIGIPGRYSEILERAGLEIVYPPAGLDLAQPARLIEQLQGIDAVLASVEPYTAEVQAAAKLRVIARMGVGYDSVDVDAATAHGTLVTITPGTNEQSVAELTISLITGVYRGFPRRDRLVRAGRWDRGPMPRLGGKTLGLVGLGRIGKAVVPKAQGLGLKVIASDPYADAGWTAAQGVRLCALDDLFREADIVSLHVPCTAETADLINARTLGLMKRGSVVINTSRGGLVDEPALTAALVSGQLLGAGLDVFKVEPPPADHPWFSLENALLSPHNGGLDEESQEAMGNMAAQCLADLFRGAWPQGCVCNPQLRAGWKW